MLALGGLLDEASCLVIEEHVLCSWAHRPTGSCEAPNVVVCGCASRRRAGPVGCAIGLRCRGTGHWRTVSSWGRHDEGKGQMNEVKKKERKIGLTPQVSAQKRHI